MIRSLLWLSGVRFGHCSGDQVITLVIGVTPGLQVLPEEGRARERKLLSMFLTSGWLQFQVIGLRCQFH